MSLHVDERPDGQFALFIDGDLQFDSADEALYHEGLALPALALAAHRNPQTLSVLICGGGDGLALRECLRFPGVARADLVDLAPEVIELGRTRFASLNDRAFEDPRVTVHIADAWDFITAGATYDVVICDFTVPRADEYSRVFTAQWYERLGAALAPDGIAALNGCSPQATPEAFWCLRRTIRACGLSALPYAVCIPSFRKQGYGAWGFFLGSHRMVTQADLRHLRIPVATRQVDPARLWRGTRFRRAARALEARVPVHTLAAPCLVRLMLDPEALRSQPAMGSRAPTPDCLLPAANGPLDLAPLMNAIRVLHPYHTREMIETLADHVAGTIRSIDIRRLVDALLHRAAALPHDLLDELRRLRDFLREHGPRLDSFQTWCYRLFAALVIVITLANAIAPDNAFAKGAHGLGHASMSRGFSGGFAGGRGGFEGTSPGSVHVSGSGFRGSYGRGGMTDVFGYSYHPRTFYFHSYHSTTYVGGHTTGTVKPAPPSGQNPASHRALFVADEDMLVLDSGDVIITLSDATYLLASGGTLSLMHEQSPDPLLTLYPDPALFDMIHMQVADQQSVIRKQEEVRRDWLGWVGWTSALFPLVAGDKRELRNMQDLNRRLSAAAAKLGSPPSGATPAKAQPGQVELFVGSYLLPDSTVAIRQNDGRWLYVNGREMRYTATGPVTPCPPLVTETLRSIMAKLQKELMADLSSNDNDLRLLAQDKAQLDKDLQEYQSIYASNGYQSDYEVDYGTDSIPVSQAIQRTQSDIATNQQETAQATAQRDKTAGESARIAAALQSFGKQPALPPQPLVSGSGATPAANRAGSTQPAGITPLPGAAEPTGQAQPTSTTQQAVPAPGAGATTPTPPKH